MTFVVPAVVAGARSYSGPVSFDSGYRRWRLSRAHAALLGEGYPETIEPFSFVPFSSLTDIAATLTVGSGQTLVDLGCGRGGIGLWLAHRIGSDLIGVDSSSVAVTDARGQASQHPWLGSARFVVADVARTGLVSGCASALMCVDVLQLVPDPEVVVKEMGRLLRPGGVLVLTTWEGLNGAPDRFPRQIAPMMESAGLVDVEVTERGEWLRRQFEIYSRAMEFTALGETDNAVRDLAREGRNWESIRPFVRRVSVTAWMP